MATFILSWQASDGLSWDPHKRLPSPPAPFLAIATHRSRRPLAQLLHLPHLALAAATPHLQLHPQLQPSASSPPPVLAAAAPTTSSVHPRLHVASLTPCTPVVGTSPASSTCCCFPHGHLHPHRHLHPNLQSSHAHTAWPSLLGLWPLHMCSSNALPNS
jgi:hypothetical protein